MSSAFVKESDDQWLSDIGPSTNALVNFLTRDNNGVRVYEKGTTSDKDGKVIHSIKVDAHKLYELVNMQKLQAGLLEIEVNDPGLEAYAFTFGND